MKMKRATSFVVRLISLTLVSMGFMQFAAAGAIQTSYIADAELRDARITRIETFVAEQAVSEQLLALGVAPEAVVSRLQGLSDAELVELEQRFDEQHAGGDALGVIGILFIVLLILELVGITDIFKAI